MKSVLSRIEEALAAAAEVLSRFKPGAVAFAEKGGLGPVTEADRLVNETLQRILLQDSDEGWFSEESVDDPSRLSKRSVWIVDPLDGTREFVEGIPEWSVSIGFVEGGIPTAGGISNPATRETFIGSLETGVLYNGAPVRASARRELDGALVLASRTEVKRGEWQRFRNAPFEIRPVGSVAYKLARVAAGLADATWTLTPKNEWDVAAGIALVRSAGGIAKSLDDLPLKLNSRSSRLSGLIASGPLLAHPIGDFLQPYLPARAPQPAAPVSV